MSWPEGEFAKPDTTDWDTPIEFEAITNRGHWCARLRPGTAHRNPVRRVLQPARLDDHRPRPDDRPLHPARPLQPDLAVAAVTTERNNK